MIRGPLPALRHGPAQPHPRLLLAALDDALDQVECLFLDDRLEVPSLLEARIRGVVERVDSRLAFQVDQMGASPGALQGIIFAAEGLLMKRHRLSMPSSHH